MALPNWLTQPDTFGTDEERRRREAELLGLDGQQSLLAPPQQPIVAPIAPTPATEQPPLEPPKVVEDPAVFDARVRQDKENWDNILTQAGQQPIKTPLEAGLDSPESLAPAPQPKSDGIKPGVQRWDELVAEASHDYNVPESVIKAIIDIESSGDESAVSRAGAMSLMQVMPFHFAPGEDGMDPRTNIRKGTELLARNYDRYGSWDRAAGAYFGAIDANGNVTNDPDINGKRGVDYVYDFLDAESRYTAAPSVPLASAPQQKDPWLEGASAIGLTPRQDETGFGAGLDYETTWAICGPVAALAFAARMGRYPDVREALDLAREVGWTVKDGMAGVDSQVKLLEKLGIAASLEHGAPNWDKVAQDVANGNPVIINTRGHYFVAEGYDAATGRFDFGNSARVLTAASGQSKFTPAELEALGMGSANAAIYLDNPGSQAPSVVAGRLAEPNPSTLPSRISSTEDPLLARINRSIQRTYESMQPQAQPQEAQARPIAPVQQPAPVQVPSAPVQPPLQPPIADQPAPRQRTATVDELMGKAEPVEDPSLGIGQSYSNALVRGAYNTVAGVFGGLGVASRLVGFDTFSDWAERQDNAWKEEIRKDPDLLRTNGGILPGGIDEKVIENAPQVLGSLVAVGLGAAAAVFGSAPLAVGATAVGVGSLAVGMLGAAGGMSDELQSYVRDGTISQTTADIAAASSGAMEGVLEKFTGGAVGAAATPIRRMLAREIAQEAAKKGLGHITREWLAETGNEALEEAFAEIYGNAIKKVLVDKDQSLLEGVLEAALVGGISGGIIGGIGQGAQAATGRVADARARRAADEFLATTTLAGRSDDGEMTRRSLNELAYVASMAPGSPEERAARLEAVEARLEGLSTLELARLSPKAAAESFSPGQAILQDGADRAVYNVLKRRATTLNDFFERTGDAESAARTDAGQARPADGDALFADSGAGPAIDRVAAGPGAGEGRGYGPSVADRAGDGAGGARPIYDAADGRNTGGTANIDVRFTDDAADVSDPVTGERFTVSRVGPLDIGAISASLARMSGLPVDADRAARYFDIPQQLREGLGDLQTARRRAANSGADRSVIADYDSRIDRAARAVSAAQLTLGRTRSADRNAVSDYDGVRLSPGVNPAQSLIEQAEQARVSAEVLRRDLSPVDSIRAAAERAGAIQRGGKPYSLIMPSWAKLKIPSSRNRVVEAYRRALTQRWFSAWSDASASSVSGMVRAVSDELSRQFAGGFVVTPTVYGGATDEVNLHGVNWATTTGTAPNAIALNPYTLFMRSAQVAQQVGIRIRNEDGSATTEFAELFVARTLATVAHEVAHSMRLVGNAQNREVTGDGHGADHDALTGLVMAAAETAMPQLMAAYAPMFEAASFAEFLQYLRDVDTMPDPAVEQENQAAPQQSDTAQQPQRAPPIVTPGEPYSPEVTLDGLLDMRSRDIPAALARASARDLRRIISDVNAMRTPPAEVAMIRDQARNAMRALSQSGTQGGTRAEEVSQDESVASAMPEATGETDDATLQSIVGILNSTPLQTPDAKANLVERLTGFGWKPLVDLYNKASRYHLGYEDKDLLSAAMGRFGIKTNYSYDEEAQRYVDKVDVPKDPQLKGEPTVAVLEVLQKISGGLLERAKAEAEASTEGAWKKTLLIHGIGGELAEYGREVLEETARFLYDGAYASSRWAIDHEDEVVRKNLLIGALDTLGVQALVDDYGRKFSARHPNDPRGEKLAPWPDNPPASVRTRSENEVPTVGGGSVSVGSGVDMSRLPKQMAQNQYMGNYALLATRELAQNAIDAVAMGGGTSFSIQVGQQEVMNEDDRQLERAVMSTDNGVGMTPQLLVKEFLDVGGTGKTGTDTIGGFGTAKLIFLGNSELLVVRTVARDENGRLVETILYGSSKDYFDGTMKSVSGDPDSLVRYYPSIPSKMRGSFSELVGGQTGTVVYARALGGDLSFNPSDVTEYARTFHDYAELRRPVNYRFDVPSYYGDQPIVVESASGHTYQYGPQRTDVADEFDIKLRSPQTGKEVVVASVRIKQSPRAKTIDGYMGKTVSVIQSNQGLPQATGGVKVPGDPDEWHYYTVDVESRVAPEEFGYPWLPDRKGLIKSVDDVVNSHVHQLVAKAADEVGDRYKDALENVRTIGDARLVDTSLSKDESGVGERIAGGEAAQQIARVIGSVYDGIRSEIDESGYWPSERTRVSPSTFHAFDLAGGTQAVNFLGRAFFEKNSPNLVTLSLWAIAHKIGRRTGVISGEDGSTQNRARLQASRKELANQLLFVLTHEHVHDAARSHDEQFSFHLSNVVGIVTMGDAHFRISEAIGKISDDDLLQLYADSLAWNTQFGKSKSRVKEQEGKRDLGVTDDRGQTGDADLRDSGAPGSARSSVPGSVAAQDRGPGAEPGADLRGDQGQGDQGRPGDGAVPAELRGPGERGARPLNEEVGAEDIQINPETGAWTLTPPWSTEQQTVGDDQMPTEYEAQDWQEVDNYIEGLVNDYESLFNSSDFDASVERIYSDLINRVPSEVSSVRAVAKRRFDYLREIGQGDSEQAIILDSIINSADAAIEDGGVTAGNNATFDQYYEEGDGDLPSIVDTERIDRIIYDAVADLDEADSYGRDAVLENFRRAVNGLDDNSKGYLLDGLYAGVGPPGDPGNVNIGVLISNYYQALEEPNPANDVPKESVAPEDAASRAFNADDLNAQYELGRLLAAGDYLGENRRGLRLHAESAVAEVLASIPDRVLELVAERAPGFLNDDVKEQRLLGQRIRRELDARRSGERSVEDTSSTVEQYRKDRRYNSLNDGRPSGAGFDTSYAAISAIADKIKRPPTIALGEGNRPVPGLYSQLAAAITSMKIDPTRQKDQNFWRNELQKAGVKPDEMVWSGLDGFLKSVASRPKGQPKTASLEELSSVIAEERTALTELVLYSRDANDDVRYDAKPAANALYRAQQNYEYYVHDAVLSDLYESGTGMNWRDRARAARRITSELIDNVVQSPSIADAAASASYADWVKVERGRFRNAIEDVEAEYDIKISALTRLTLAKLAKLEGLRHLVSVYETSSSGRNTLWDVYKEEDLVLNGGRNYRELLVFWEPSEEQRGPSTHWTKHNNVLAHVRFDDREATDGTNLVFVEEFQSDWLQKLRDEGVALAPGEMQSAFKDLETRFSAAYVAANRDGLSVGVSVRSRGVTEFEPIPYYDFIDVKTGRRIVDGRILESDDYFSFSGSPDATAATAEQVAFIERAKEPLDAIYKDARKFDERRYRGVTNAPYAKDDAWARMLLRRMLVLAASEGKDAVAWTTGGQQSWRYSPLLHMRSIAWNPSTGEASIELARPQAWGRPSVSFTATNEQEFTRNVSSPQLWAKLQAAPTNAQGLRVVEGSALHNEKPGMVQFYDKTMRSFAEKIGKEFGARVRTVEIEIPRYETGLTISEPSSDGYGPASYRILDRRGREQYSDTPLETREDAEAAIERMESAPPIVERVMALELTDEMRAAIERTGLPQFSEEASTEQDQQAPSDEKVSASDLERRSLLEVARNNPILREKSSPENLTRTEGALALAAENAPQSDYNRAAAAYGGAAERVHDGIATHRLRPTGTAEEKANEVIAAHNRANDLASATVDRAEEGGVFRPETEQPDEMASRVLVVSKDMRDALAARVLVNSAWIQTLAQILSSKSRNSVFSRLVSRVEEDLKKAYGRDTDSVSLKPTVFGGFMLMEGRYAVNVPGEGNRPNTVYLNPLMLLRATIRELGMNGDPVFTDGKPSQAFYQAFRNRITRALSHEIAHSAEVMTSRDVEGRREMVSLRTDAHGYDHKEVWGRVDESLREVLDQEVGGTKLSDAFNFAFPQDGTELAKALQTYAIATGVTHTNATVTERTATSNTNADRLRDGDERGKPKRAGRLRLSGQESRRTRRGATVQPRAGGLPGDADAPGAGADVKPAGAAPVRSAPPGPHGPNGRVEQDGDEHLAPAVIRNGTSTAEQASASASHAVGNVEVRGQADLEEQRPELAQKVAAVAKEQYLAEAEPSVRRLVELAFASVSGRFRAKPKATPTLRGFLAGALGLEALSTKVFGSKIHAIDVNPYEVYDRYMRARASIISSVNDPEIAAQLMAQYPAPGEDGFGAAFSQALARAVVHEVIHVWRDSNVHDVATYGDGASSSVSVITRLLTESREYRDQVAAPLTKAFSGEQLQRFLSDYRELRRLATDAQETTAAGPETTPMATRGLAMTSTQVKRQADRIREMVDSFDDTGEPPTREQVEQFLHGLQVRGDESGAANLQQAGLTAIVRMAATDAARNQTDNDRPTRDQIAEQYDRIRDLFIDWFEQDGVTEDLVLTSDNASLRGVGSRVTLKGEDRSDPQKRASLYRGNTVNKNQLRSAIDALFGRYRKDRSIKKQHWVPLVNKQRSSSGDIQFTLEDQRVAIEQELAEMNAEREKSGLPRLHMIAAVERNKDLKIDQVVIRPASDPGLHERLAVPALEILKKLNANLNGVKDRAERIRISHAHYKELADMLANHQLASEIRLDLLRDAMIERYLQATKSAGTEAGDRAAKLIVQFLTSVKKLQERPSQQERAVKRADGMVLDGLGRYLISNGTHDRAVSRRLVEALRAASESRQFSEVSMSDLDALAEVLVGAKPEDRDQFEANVNRLAREVARSMSTVDPAATAMLLKRAFAAQIMRARDEIAEWKRKQAEGIASSDDAERAIKAIEDSLSASELGLATRRYGEMAGRTLNVFRQASALMVAGDAYDRARALRVDIQMARQAAERIAAYHNGDSQISDADAQRELSFLEKFSARLKEYADKGLLNPDDWLVKSAPRQKIPLNEASVEDLVDAFVEGRIVTPHTMRSWRSRRNWRDDQNFGKQQLMEASLSVAAESYIERLGAIEREHMAAHGNEAETTRLQQEREDLLGMIEVELVDAFRDSFEKMRDRQSKLDARELLALINTVLGTADTGWIAREARIEALAGQPELLAQGVIRRIREQHSKLVVSEEARLNYWLKTAAELQAKYGAIPEMATHLAELEDGIELELEELGWHQSGGREAAERVRERWMAARYGDGRQLVTTLFGAWYGKPIKGTRATTAENVAVNNQDFKNGLGKLLSKALIDPSDQEARTAVRDYFAAVRGNRLADQIAADAESLLDMEGLRQEALFWIKEVERQPLDAMTRRLADAAILAVKAKADDDALPSWLAKRFAPSVFSLTGTRDRAIARARVRLDREASRAEEKEIRDELRPNIRRLIKDPEDPEAGEAMMGIIDRLEQSGRTLMARRLTRLLDARTAEATQTVIEYGTDPDAEKDEQTQAALAMMERLNQLGKLRRNDRSGTTARLIAGVLSDLGTFGEVGQKLEERARAHMVAAGLERIHARYAKDRVAQFSSFMSMIDDQDPSSLGRALRYLQQPTWSQYYREYGIINMLSSPTTWGFGGTNFISQLIQVALSAPNWVLEYVGDRIGAAVQGREQTVFASELGALGDAVRMGETWKGFADAWAIMKTGHSKTELDDVLRAGDLREVRTEFWSQHENPLLRRLGVLGHMISSRPLAAMDAIFSTAVYSAHIQMQAERKAKQLGKGTTREDVLRDIVDHRDVLEQAGKIRDHTLLQTKSNMLHTILRWINTQATTGTAQQQRRGRMIELLWHSLLPFTTVPWNYTKQGVELSAIGAAYHTQGWARDLASGQGTTDRAVLDELEERRARGEQVTEEMIRRRGGEETNKRARSAAADANARFAKAAMGWLLLGTALKLAAEGLLTGDEPDDEEERERWRSNNVKPRSVLIGDTWYSYDSTPFAIPWAMAATATDRYQSNYEKARKKGEQDTAATRAAAGVRGLVQGTASGIGRNIFLENLIDLTNIVTGQSKTWERDAFNVAGGAVIGRNIPYSGMLNFLAKVADAYTGEGGFERDTRADNPFVELWNRQFTSRLPIIRETLPEQRDLRGKAIPNETTALTGLLTPARKGEDRTSVLAAILDEWEVPIDMEPKTISVGSQGLIDLTIDERRALGKSYGPKLEAAILKAVNKDFMNIDVQGGGITPELKRKLQHDALAEVAKRAREEAFIEAVFPSFGSNLDERLNEYRTRAARLANARYGDYRQPRN